MIYTVRVIRVTTEMVTVEVKGASHDDAEHLAQHIAKRDYSERWIELKKELTSEVLDCG